MRILITGGAGFIGSHLAESLLKDDGYQVTVLDDLSTGRKENIEHLLANPNFSFIEGNVLDYKLVMKLVTECDCIYHFAAAVGVKYIIDNPLDSLITNVRGTEIVLEIAQIFEKKIFFASSSEVYGKDGTSAFKEDDDRILGAVSLSRWGYAFSKGFDEFLAMAYYRTKGLKVVIGRLFNICGQRQSANYGMVVPRFVKQAIANEPITVYGDGQQGRSFIHVWDAVSAIKGLMNESRSEGEIFNIGSPDSIKIVDLAKKIKDYSGSTSQVSFIPYNEVYEKNFEDMLYRVPDISKIKNLTGFTPKLNLDEMIKVIIDDYRSK